MALNNVAALRTNIKDTLSRDDFTDAQINDFILLAEERHKNEIRCREMIQREALSVDDQFVSLPSGYLQAMVIRLLTSPVTDLEQISLQEISRVRRTGTGKPQFFTIHAQIEFETDVDQTYSGEIIYFKEFTPLDDDNTSNGLLTRSPAAYLYASLLAATPWIMDDQRIPMWAQLYAAARDGLNLSSKKSLRSGPQFARIASVIA